ncbi:hypothetical protein I550_1053 [Mycobacterium intracellulare 1956]|uniref:Uncharacterized protein n=1 Tax=Mycobacterium intracellulare 1956 TaxID=1299331 RepID=X8CPZ0_MYCIT|nr:hypothetical protein I550_1053 [Mycobacterium intracellulare 1956]
MPHVSLESHLHQSSFSAGTCNRSIRESHANHLDLLACSRRPGRFVRSTIDGRYRPRRPRAGSGGAEHSAAADQLGGQRTANPAEPRDRARRHAARGARHTGHQLPGCSLGRLAGIGDHGGHPVDPRPDAGGTRGSRVISGGGAVHSGAGAVGDARRAGVTLRGERHSGDDSGPDRRTAGGRESGRAGLVDPGLPAIPGLSAPSAPATPPAPQIPQAQVNMPAMPAGLPVNVPPQVRLPQDLPALASGQTPAAPAAPAAPAPAASPAGPAAPLLAALP